MKFYSVQAKFMIAHHTAPYLTKKLAHKQILTTSFLVLKTSVLSALFERKMRI